MALAARPYTTFVQPMSKNASSLPLGATLRHDGVAFRVWAPQARSVCVVEEGRGARGGVWPLSRDANGYFSGVVPSAVAGTLYRYQIDDGKVYADPCSRFQPEGPHGASMVVDPGAFTWTDASWRGVSLPGQVIYELHVGAFTREGTFDAAAQQLSDLKRLGVTVIELMPVAECPGRWNWGYDGVCLYAPYHVYGDPHSLKRFVNAAHGLGIAVILDVVYNHLGPDGNYLRCFSPHYFTDRYPNEWGDAMNFDGEHCGPVREFFIGNACYWLQEFHLDGLRLDATQSIHDASPVHVLAELSHRARETIHPRQAILIAENEPQDVRMIEPLSEGGHGLDGIWNDDYHHSARVALTGSHDGYFHDHRGRAQELLSAVRHGFLFQGQYYSWQRQARGTPSRGLEAWRLVHFLQNHDQVANTFYGQRIDALTSPGRLRALTALTLLGPQTPMLFMGQEFAASTPFTFFAEHGPELAEKVWQGRRAFVAQFKAYATPEAQAAIPDPAALDTFMRCKLDFSERDRHAWAYALHHDLLALRRQDPVIARQDGRAVDGAVLSEQALLLRWFAGDAEGDQGDRMLLVNLGDLLDHRPCPEPLLAPPRGHVWHLVWSSEAPLYGGAGSTSPCVPDGWVVPAACAVLLQSGPHAALCSSV